MGFPDKVTVGALLDFLQGELDKGIIDRQTPVYVETYLLSAEEELLKPKEKELGYHVPDDNMDEVSHFRLGVWHGVSGKPRESDGSYENTVALSVYFGPDKNKCVFEKAHKEVQNRKDLLK